MVQDAQKSVQIFTTTLVDYEAAPLDGLLDQYCRSQESGRVIRSVLQHREVKSEYCFIFDVVNKMLSYNIC